MTIYIVEDDTDIREMESYALNNIGYECLSFENGASLFEALRSQIPCLILLDIMLPDEDGLAILRTLRATPAVKRVPVILVTAKTTEIDKVRGLDMGADDYITKPFGIMELVSRVKAVLRRVTPVPTANDILIYRDMELDDGKHMVRLHGEPIELTYKEYELLKYMMANRDMVLTRDKLMSKVWGFDYEGESRTVDMHVKTLRQKLKDYGSDIKTVRNVGYKLGE